MKSRLALVNMGHGLKITSYWVKDAWLLRVIDPAGNRVRGGYALLNDNNSDLAADSAALENIIQFRDQAEKQKAKGTAPKRPDVGRPGNEFLIPTFKEPDLSGIEEPDLSGIETPEEVLESLRDQNEEEETPARPTPGEAVFDALFHDDLEALDNA